MKPTFSFITLAVTDLNKSLAFYRDGLGWPTDGIVGQEYHDEVTGADGTIAFFKLSNGVTLGLYERHNLAKDAHLEIDSQSSTEFSLGYIADSRNEVDQILNQAVEAGAVVTGPAHLKPFGFYSGYFQDPDCHLWEIGCDKDSLPPDKS